MLAQTMLSSASVAVSGDGLMGMWITHAMKTYPGIKIYDQSAAATNFRQQEVALGQKGVLDAAGQANAQRTAQNMANPQATDAKITFSGPPTNSTVTVTCKNGMQKRFQISLNGLTDADIKAACAALDNAIAACKGGPGGMV